MMPSFWRLLRHSGTPIRHSGIQVTSFWHPSYVIPGLTRNPRHNAAV
ncbi:MAG: hypothetical protein LBM21_01395 [Coriobacteriales bacterium]|nr:hypothetical protein [Coriobacteriales bacterium]